VLLEDMPALGGDALDERVFKGLDALMREDHVDEGHLHARPLSPARRRCARPPAGVPIPKSASSCGTLVCEFRTRPGMTFLRIVIPALASCLSMIFSENRCTLFGIML
jgi:hypothetical protein